MMYHMKKIIAHDEEMPIPKCMYSLKKIYTFNDLENLSINEEINISKQIPRKEMAELEIRQDQLLKKLDILYDKIKSISAVCDSHKTNVKSKVTDVAKVPIAIPEEIVLTVSADNLPWFIKVIMKRISPSVNFNWHIHSSVPTERVSKIKTFLKDLKSTCSHEKITLRLIFKCVSADPELKLSSLQVPIVGYVNILRYLCLAYPTIAAYDDEDYYVDSLLDICHILERTNEKNKEAVAKKIFSQYDGWIYKKTYSVVDLAAYNVIKQWRNCPKYVPKDWFDKLNQQ